jgi:hypothetical protein
VTSISQSHQFVGHPDQKKSINKPELGASASYSGGRDQEDCNSKLAQENSPQNPISKKTFTNKKGWWSGSRYRP